VQLLKDGNEVYVEYGSGPRAFSARWEGRPFTPDFEWDGEGMVLPAHDTWLESLDLVREGVHELVSKDMREADSEGVARDLAAVKAQLKAHAGPLQACFLVYEFQARARPRCLQLTSFPSSLRPSRVPRITAKNTVPAPLRQRCTALHPRRRSTARAPMQGSKDLATVGRLNLTQFKAFCAAARVTGGKFPADRLDDVFTAAAASAAARERKLDGAAGSTMALLDFIVALAHVAAHRFAALVRQPQTLAAPAAVPAQRGPWASHQCRASAPLSLLLACMCLASSLCTPISSSASKSERWGRPCSSPTRRRTRG
jgi:hypothetical protein